MKWSVNAGVVDTMWAMVEELFPIHRTLVNDGIRNSLELIRSSLDIAIHEFPSGMHVWDWIIPEAWNVNQAYIADLSGRKLVDFRNNNLHLAAYSCPFQGRLTKAELLEHIWTLPDQPDAIPYRTLYYKENQWRFCLAHDELSLFNDDDQYEVCIDVDLRPGKLCVGEFVLPGKTDKEIWLTSYLCHPSLANDNLSGVALAVSVMKTLASMPDRQYSYRLLLWPESIGATTYLASHEQILEKVVGGYVFTCCGDAGPITYKKSYFGNTLIDQAALHALRYADRGNYSIRDFWLNGSDEQKFNAPGVRLPFGSFMRTPYSEFPEYHTSKDNLSFISKDQLAEILSVVLKALFIADTNRIYEPLYKGEPFLSKHGLHRQVDLKRPDRKSLAYIQRVLTMETDGHNSLLDIANKWDYHFDDILDESIIFSQAGLFKALN
ncbi:MAG: DUF4910 domain-containing protein [Deltaproteobacteria bacterium]|nr:DUF4910 domain-containing protein [Deltaproteobacteria bacterium]